MLTKYLKKQKDVIAPKGRLWREAFERVFALKSRGNPLKQGDCHAFSNPFAFKKGSRHRRPFGAVTRIICFESVKAKTDVILVR